MSHPPIPQWPHGHPREGPTDRPTATDRAAFLSVVVVVRSVDCEGEWGTYRIRLRREGIDRGGEVRVRQSVRVLFQSPDRPSGVTP